MECMVWRLLLTISGVEVVDICVAEGTTGHGITANTDAIDGPRSGKLGQNDRKVATNLATGPIMLKISKSIASVTVGSSSPT